MIDIPPIDSCTEYQHVARWARASRARQTNQLSHDEQCLAHHHASCANPSQGQRRPSGESPIQHPNQKEYFYE